MFPPPWLSGGSPHSFRSPTSGTATAATCGRTSSPGCSPSCTSPSCPRSTAPFWSGKRMRTLSPSSWAAALTSGWAMCVLGHRSKTAELQWSSCAQKSCTEVGNLGDWGRGKVINRDEFDQPQDAEVVINAPHSTSTMSCFSASSTDPHHGALHRQVLADERLNCAEVGSSDKMFSILLPLPWRGRRGRTGCQSFNLQPIEKLWSELEQQVHEHRPRSENKRGSWRNNRWRRRVGERLHWIS